MAPTVPAGILLIVRNMRTKHWLLTLALSALFLTPPLAIGQARGGNSDGGGSPNKVRAGALKLLIQGDGLKRAMLNYVQTVPLGKIDDGYVRTKLGQMMLNGSLEQDIQDSQYVLAKPTTPCRDAYNDKTPASTKVGILGSDVCFDVDRLAEAYQGMNDEEMMVNLASLAFHEHTHHYQKFDPSRIQQNEDEANRVAGYILITAKFVQLPLLAWFEPASGPAQFQVIQSMYEAIRAKERAFIAPAPTDYANYPGYQGQTDRGVIRLLPRETYDKKLSILGGGAYYSFTRLTHEQDYSSDLKWEQKELSVGFAGCDFGQFVDLGKTPLEQVTLRRPELKYLVDFTPAVGESNIRIQQEIALDKGVQVGRWQYTARESNIQAGETFGLRSINFDESDVLVAFQIVRIDNDGSLILAWKKLIQFPAPSCH